MEALRRRLEDTEAAMERLMGQMGNVSDKLSQAKLSEVLMQAQTQAQTIKVNQKLLPFLDINVIICL